MNLNRKKEIGELRHTPPPKWGATLSIHRMRISHTPQPSPMSSGQSTSWNSDRKETEYSRQTIALTIYLYSFSYTNTKNYKNKYAKTETRYIGGSSHYTQHLLERQKWPQVTPRDPKWPLDLLSLHISLSKPWAMPHTQPLQRTCCTISSTQRSVRDDPMIICSPGAFDMGAWKTFFWWLPTQQLFK